MIVEDNDLEVHLFRSVLQSLDYNVVVASNGQEAFDLLDHYHPALILMDIRLPGGISGWDIAHEVKSSQLAHIPIVMMTAHGFPDDKQHMLELGCEDYLIKPIDVTSLRTAIPAHIAGRTSV